MGISYSSSFRDKKDISFIYLLFINHRFFSSMDIAKGLCIVFILESIAIPFNFLKRSFLPSGYSMTVLIRKLNDQ
jgi:hypothetical protein